MTATQKVDIRELITEIMETQEATGKSENDALAHCISEVRKRKEHLMDAFFDQYIESAVRDIQANRVQRENQRIREAQDARKEKPEAGGGRAADDTHLLNASPGAGEGGGGHGVLDTRVRDAAPTFRQLRKEKWEAEDQAEAGETPVSIMDHRYYIGEGIGRVRLREMTFGQARRVRQRHWRWTTGHYYTTQFMNSLTGDPWEGPWHGPLAKKSEIPDDTPLLEYLTEAEIEAKWNACGRPVPPADPADE